MTSDYQIVAAVKTEFTRRLPSDLVALVLEFANCNADRKQEMMSEFVRFAEIIPEMYQPNSEYNIYATVCALRKKRPDPRLHIGLGVPNAVRNLSFSLQCGPGAQIEPKYASCLHPTTICGGGCTATIISWRDAWLSHLAMNRTHNFNGVVHPFLQRRRQAQAANAMRKRACIVGFALGIISAALICIILSQPRSSSTHASNSASYLSCILRIWSATTCWCPLTPGPHLLQ
jgi:hypothetical protein